ncbi:hypothetical protein BKA81DRAFT_356843, partial [Phyllosticta paracitricarpa]
MSTLFVAACIPSVFLFELADLVVAAYPCRGTLLPHFNHHLFLSSSLLLHLASLFRVGLVCDATYFPTCLSACLRRLSIGCRIPSSSPFLVLN